MLKHYLGRSFLLCLFFLTPSAICMNRVRDTTKDAYDSSAFSDRYISSIIYCIDSINQGFFNAFAQAETNLPQAKYEISQSCHWIKQLSNILTEFELLQKKQSKAIFKTMAEKSSGIEKDIIETKIIPAIAQQDTYTKELCNTLAAHFTDIQNKLKLIGHTQHNSDEFCKELEQITNQYQAIFDRFSATQPQRNTDLASTVLQTADKLLNSNAIASTAKSFIFNNVIASSEHKVQVIFNKEKDIDYHIKYQKPSIPKMFILDTVSLVAKIISWMPFRNTICAWLLKENNTFLKRILTYFFGKKEYKKIIQHVAILYLKKMQKVAHVGAVGNGIHNFLQSPAGKTFKNLLNGKPYFDHLQALQEYSFIQLLKCLQQTHNRSKKILSTKKSFSFNYEPENIPPIVLQQQVETRTSIPVQLYQAADQAAGTIVDSGIKLFNYIKAHDKQTIINDTKHALSEYGGLFVSSFLPWYRLPNKSAIQIAQNNNAPANPILAKPKTGNITDFIHHCFDTYNKHDLDTPFGKQLNYYENIFTDLLTIHEGFDTEINENYQEHKKKFKDLPENWHNLPSKIDLLHQSLKQLQKDRKELWFFQILSDIAHKHNIRKTWQSLQQHIDTYNSIKIDLYSKQDSSSLRNKFLQEFKLSHQDNIDLFKISQNNPKFSKCIYAFNPLERAELHKELV